MKMTDINPTMSVITLNVRGLSRPVKWQKLGNKRRSNYMLPIGDAF